MASGTGEVDGKYYEVARSGTFAERLMAAARRRMYRDFVRLAAVGEGETILDIGVSDVMAEGANMLEVSDPHPGRITAVGLGEGAGFQATFPAIRYVRIEPHAPLPFGDKAFDIATSNAVLEHAGGDAAQHAMISEMCRVARRVFLTVPHRFFPVEHHTGLPFLHWSDVTFGPACRLAGRARWADPRELILMSRGRLRALVPAGWRARIGTTGLALGPFSSNLYLALDPLSR